MADGGSPADTPVGAMPRSYQVTPAVLGRGGRHGKSRSDPDQVDRRKESQPAAVREPNRRAGRHRPPEAQVLTEARSRSRCHAAVETRIHAAGGLKAAVRIAPASANLQRTGLLRRVVCCRRPGPSNAGVFDGGWPCATSRACRATLVPGPRGRGLPRPNDTRLPGSQLPDGPEAAVARIRSSCALGSRRWGARSREPAIGCQRRVCREHNPAIVASHEH